MRWVRPNTYEELGTDDLLLDGPSRNPTRVNVSFFCFNSLGHGAR